MQDLARRGDDPALIVRGLRRLKIAGHVGRTGDTWSLVGVGMEDRV